MEYILSKISGSQAVFIYRLLGAFKGPIIMLLIVAFLDDVEQGEWFLFTSLGAISALVDLGFGTMMSNFIANARGQGNSKEVAYLIHLTRSTYLWLAICGVTMMSLIGLFFVPPNLFLYFLAYMLASGLNLMVSWKTVSFMGLNRVKEAHVALSLGVLASTTILMVLVPMGITLLALMASIMVQASVLFGTLKFFEQRQEIQETFVDFEIKDHVSMKRSAFKVFGKYAVSWIFGFLIFNAYVPILSKQVGLEESGKVGLLLAMYSACLSLSLTWIQADTPKIAMLRGQEKMRCALVLWKRGVYRAFGVLSLGIVAVILLTYLDIPEFPINKKLPQLAIVGALGIVFLVRLWGSVTATFIRAGKKEKHTIINICTGCFMVATLMCATPENILSVFGIIAIYSSVILTPVYAAIIRSEII